MSGAANVSQQRRPVDLGREIVAFQLLDRSRHRPESGEVLSGGLDVEPAQPAVGADQACRARGGWIEMVLEIQIGPAEVVNRGVGHQARLAVASEWSPRLALPRKFSRMTLLPRSEPSSSTPVSRLSRPTIELRTRLPLILVPRSIETLGPISLRSMLTPSSM